MIGLKGVRRPVHVDNFAVFVRLAQTSSDAPHRCLLATCTDEQCRVSTQVPPVRYDADKDDLICVTGFFVHPHPASHTHTSMPLLVSVRAGVPRVCCVRRRYGCALGAPSWCCSVALCFFALPPSLFLSTSSLSTHSSPMISFFKV